MSHAFIQINEGSEKKLAHNLRTIGADDIYEQKIVISEPFMPAYVITTTASIVTTTANDHLLQIFAGSTNRFVLRRLVVRQTVAVGTAGNFVFQLLRITTAGTGGTSYTPRPMDPGDPACDATAMSRPTAKGTESHILWEDQPFMWQTTNTEWFPPMIDLDFTSPLLKGFEVAASNGIALKNTGAGGGSAAIRLNAIFVERTWN